MHDSTTAGLSVFFNLAAFVTRLAKAGFGPFGLVTPTLIIPLIEPRLGCQFCDCVIYNWRFWRHIYTTCEKFACRYDCTCSGENEGKSINWKQFEKYRNVNDFKLLRNFQQENKNG